MREGTKKRRRSIAPKTACEMVAFFQPSDLPLQGCVRLQKSTPFCNSKTPLKGSLASHCKRSDFCNRRFPMRGGWMGSRVRAGESDGERGDGVTEGGSDRVKDRSQPFRSPDLVDATSAIVDPLLTPLTPWPVDPSLATKLSWRRVWRPGLSQGAEDRQPRADEAIAFTAGYGGFNCQRTGLPVAPPRPPLSLVSAGDCSARPRIIASKKLFASVMRGTRGAGGKTSRDVFAFEVVNQLATFWCAKGAAQQRDRRRRSHES